MAVRSGNKTRKVALAGNPNSGKTSLFNALTGARRKVGNYPGVTVERLEGRYEHDDVTYDLTDLPGTYSLSAMSAEERVARQFVAEAGPDVVVDVVDSTNLERNLYLTIQLLEMDANVVLALNMADEARESGLELDVKLLSDLLGGVPVVETEGHRGRGTAELKDVVAAAAANRLSVPPLSLGHDLERSLERILEALEDVKSDPYPARWVAIKLLEGDEELRRHAESMGEKGRAALEAAQREADSLKKLSGEDPVVMLADRRYGFVAGLLREVMVRQPPVDRITQSEKIDQVLTHRVLGLPLFFLALYALFWVTFRLGEPLADWMELGFTYLGTALSGLWSPGSESLIRSLLVDGLIGGVGGVLVFLPQVVLLFLGLSFLEDTGYMARAAFLMDRVMHRIGLHGKSFIPMMVGFGCNVPAVMACRILENERDRLVTMLVLPLISCGARLPGYLVIIAAFFPSSHKASVLMGVYVFGVLMAALLARLLRSTVLSGEDAPFVMELPPYRMPTPKAVSLHAWERAWMYLKKAGTIILGISLLLWGLSSFPVKEKYDVDRKVAAGQTLSKKRVAAERSKERLEYSMAGRLGRVMEPALSPMGFDWRIGTAFLGAFAAKEVFVAQMGIVFSAGDVEEDRSTLSAMIGRHYRPLTGIAMIIFLLMATPCMATFAVVKKESGSWKWPVFQWIGLTLLGYFLATLVFQVGSLLGW